MSLLLALDRLGREYEHEWLPDLWDGFSICVYARDRVDTVGNDIAERVSHPLYLEKNERQLARIFQCFRPALQVPGHPVSKRITNARAGNEVTTR